MATATMSAPGFDRALHGVTGAVRRDVHEMVGSGQFYVTPELTRELGHVSSGVDHIRLDQQLMATSKDWGVKFDPQALNTERRGASQALDSTAATMFDLKNDLSGRRMKSLQDNQARETHHVAMAKLKDTERTLGPYAHASTDRIKQFCDHIGVTDRYTGYRNNLNRGSRDPVRLGYSWLDGEKKNVYNGNLNVGWKPATSTPSTMPPRHMLPDIEPRHVSAPVAMQSESVPTRSNKPNSNRCIQEQCGINMTFPGRTEYMNRFVRPRPLHQSLPDYRINPAPDFTIYGRPNAKAAGHLNITEYQTRYEWPDSAKIDKRPWIRK